MKLTTQQSQALKKIEAFIDDPKLQVFILRGYAGTGKTTLVNTLLEHLKKKKKFLKNHTIELMAPTGRAAKVLADKVNQREVNTIHRSIYYNPTTKYTGTDSDEERVATNSKETHTPVSLDAQRSMVERGKRDVTIFNLRSFAEKYSDDTALLAIIDEASMVGAKKKPDTDLLFGSGSLLEDLLNYANKRDNDDHMGGYDHIKRKGHKFIFVGDPLQLPPIGEETGQAMEEHYFSDLGLGVESYELTEVVRQSQESPITNYATTLREAYLKHNVYPMPRFKMSPGELEIINKSQVAKSYCDCLRRGESATIICFTNKQVAEYNRLVRQELFPNHDELMVGDRLIVMENNYFFDTNTLFNGDYITVQSIEGDGIELEQLLGLQAPILGEYRRRRLSYRVISYALRDTPQPSNEENKEDDNERITILESLLYCDTPQLGKDEQDYLTISAKANFSELKEVARQRHVSPPFNDFGEYRRNSLAFNALAVKFGYATTCHKAQGGEWDNVFLDAGWRPPAPKDALRWQYTAITRATRRLFFIFKDNSFPALPDKQ